MTSQSFSEPSASADSPVVRVFHHTLLWPITLRPLRRDPGADVIHYWETLNRAPGHWKFVSDTLLIEDESCVAGYEEFVYFLPYVQRFLYGVGDEGRGAQSSIYAFRREDVKAVDVILEEGDTPIHLDVRRLRLYFFYDIDVAVMAFEVAGRDIPLEQAAELLDRFGRPYPPAWDAHTSADHCPHKVTLYAAEGKKLAESDYDNRQKYLDLVRGERQTPISSHWEYLLAPLVPAYKEGGTIKYYQIENKRIPIMSYLALDDPHELTRGDMVRLGFAAKWGDSRTLPYAEQFLEDFERKHCYDRYWDRQHAGTHRENPNATDMNTRYMFCGVSFTMITQHGATHYDLLRQFRHQFYQIGLIANFNKAALLSLSNRFSRAVERLNVREFESVKQFKKHVRETLEVFLRFNHRYWFHEISNQVQASEFFSRWMHELGSDDLYNEVREEARDINEYLDADRARKQTDNAMRLTVVSSCGMVGTVVTGFLGMNLFSHAELPGWEKAIIFLIVFVPTVALSVYTVVVSRRLANFMEALSSEGLTWREKASQFRQIWGVDKRAAARERLSNRGLSSDL